MKQKNPWRSEVFSRYWSNKIQARLIKKKSNKIQARYIYKSVEICSWSLRRNKNSWLRGMWYPIEQNHRLDEGSRGALAAKGRFQRLVGRLIYLSHTFKYFLLYQCFWSIHACTMGIPYRFCLPYSLVSEIKP